MKKSLLTLMLGLALALPASAVPFLQLDTSPGHYVGGDEESIEATANPFDLYALVNSLGGDSGSGKNANPAGFLSKTYYLSAAIVPRRDPGDTSFGFFSIDGVTYSAANMAHGVPPLESMLTKDAHDLAQHGVYPTYFIELAFSLDPAVRSSLYNTQDNPGGPTDDPLGPLYYHSWEINVAGLASDLFDVHFDLYTVKTYPSGDRDVEYFAPFSHDAISGPHTVDQPELPDGGTTLALLGLALVGLGGLRHRFVRKT